MKHYIIFDLEATCIEDRAVQFTNEIIEIGAVKLDENLNQIDTFQTFIRPTINPVLSEFCITLTTIQQQDVENGEGFDEALQRFASWMMVDTDEVMLLSWGHYDKKQILNEAKMKGYDGEIYQLLDDHRSLKHDFAKMKKIRACGMQKALALLQIEQIGTHHRGIDDALNIAEIFKVIYEEYKGWLVEENVSEVKINLRMSSIFPMLEFLRDLKEEQASRSQLTEVFNHPDYDYEFRRYEVATKNPLIDYFLNLNTITNSEIPFLRSSRKTELIDKHPLWLSVYEHPKHYELVYNKVKQFFTDEMLSEVATMVNRGLPDGLDIGTVDVICTMGIGGSYGYVFDGAFHFDLLILGMNDTYLKELPLLLAHETHHVAMMRYGSDFDHALTLAERYIYGFASEGLALKFCNNAEGIISRRLYEERPANEGLDGFSMNYLNGKFDEALDVFKRTLAGICAGAIGQKEVNQQFNEYWLNFHTEEQHSDETPKLRQPLLYSFGNDLFGAIYDAYGKETLFDCVRYPLKAIEYFEHLIKR